MLLLLGFLLLQLLLATPWMRAKVAGKLSQRIGGLEVGIGSLSWTPWSGAKIGGLEVKQPEVLRELVPTPLLVVDEIHVWPDYAAGLKGKISVTEVKVLRPKLHVTADMLVSIAAASMPPADPPAIASVVPSPAPVSGELPKVAPADQSEPPLKGEMPEQKPEVVTKSPHAPVPVPKVLRKRVQLVVEDGGFELLRVGMKKRLVGVEGVNLDLPLFGEAGESSSSVALIECFGQTLDEELSIKVKTEGDGMAFHFLGDPSEGFGVFGRSNFALVRGLPFQVDLVLRLPEVGNLAISETFSGQCEEVQARIQGGGWLQAPGSWRGVSAFEAHKPRGSLGSIGGQVINFDSASAVVQLAAGVIQSPDFRLIGDSASILGNGWVTSRDGAAVVRLVVPYGVVGMLNGEFVKRVPDGVFAFRPLKPDNRWYSDVSVWREEVGWSVGFGDKGTVVPLNDLRSIESHR